MKAIICIGPFIHDGLARDSSWSLRLRRIDDSVLLTLHWRDKEEPTHSYSIPIDEFNKIMELVRN